MFKHFSLVIFALTAVASTGFSQTDTTRGLRVDSSYFYDRYPGVSADAIATDVVTKAKSAGVNTLFIYAYNSTYGAFYKTAYTMTAVENGYGKLNMARVLAVAAKRAGLKTVAVMPINNFKKVWDTKPAWRAKTPSGADYQPDSDTYLLSAWDPDFQTWLAGFYKDLFVNVPEFDGVEVTEPCIDYYWNKQSDYNSVANTKFKSLYPKAKLGDATWLKFRAQGLTNLIAQVNAIALTAKKQTYMVQTWPAKSDGTLFGADILRDNMGLDVEAILNLPATQKLNYFIAEFMWQQWASDYGYTLFQPYNWTRQSAIQFKKYVNGRSNAVAHVEVSNFSGSFASITPTPVQFEASLEAVKDLSMGVDVYDYNQIDTQNIWLSLAHWL